MRILIAELVEASKNVPDIENSASNDFSVSDQNYDLVNN
jgi:hypothetical protein